MEIFQGARRVRPGLSGWDDMWGPPVSGRRLRIGTGSGRERERAVGRIQSRAEVLPRGLLTFFLFSFSFFSVFF
jgi:hypothetical protein